MCERRKLDHAEALVESRAQAGLDVERFRLGLRSHAITEAFGADLEATAALAAEQGARPPRSSEGAGGAALPTVVFAGEAGRETVAGLQPLDAYRRGGRGLRSAPTGRAPRRRGGRARFGRVTTAEVELLCDLPGPRARAELWRLAESWQRAPRAGADGLAVGGGLSASPGRMDGLRHRRRREQPNHADHCECKTELGNRDQDKDRRCGLGRARLREHRPDRCIGGDARAA